MSAEDYGNDERIEALWAIKAMEHAEVYFNVSQFNCSFEINDKRFLTDFVLC